MSALWTAAELALATGGQAHGDFAGTGLAFDSREVGPGDLFIALKGDMTVIGSSTALLRKGRLARLSPPRLIIPISWSRIRRRRSMPWEWPHA